jgi:hypothetical protein
VIAQSIIYGKINVNIFLNDAPIKRNIVLSMPFGIRIYFGVLLNFNPNANAGKKFGCHKNAERLRKG